MLYFQFKVLITYVGPATYSKVRTVEKFPQKRRNKQETTAISMIELSKISDHHRVENIA